MHHGEGGVGISRLSLALDQGIVALPTDGLTLLMRPPAQVDLTAVSGQVCAYAPFKPDHDALAARGISVACELPSRADAAIVFVPRAKALARDLIAQAAACLPEGGTIVVDGDKTDGVESLLKECRKRAAVDEVFSKAHGKTFAVAAGDAFADWRALPQQVEGWVTQAGVFSADGVDPGSAALMDALPPLTGHVCDLGAGWGYLAACALRASPKIETLDLVEAEANALSCARENVSDPRAAFHWADATRWTGTYDTVICNPPFHTGRKPDPDLGRAFLATAARILSTRGSAWIVANRQLGYEASLRESFAEVLIHREGPVYKVIEARRPKGRRG